VAEVPDPDPEGDDPVDPPVAVVPVPPGEPPPGATVVGVVDPVGAVVGVVDPDDGEKVPTRCH